MTVMSRAMVLVLALRFFPGPSLTAQTVYPQPPPVGEAVAASLTGGTSGLSGERNQIQIAFATGQPVTLAVGTPRGQVVSVLGTPMIVSILERAGLIAFDGEKRLIPGPELEGEARGPRPRPSAEGGAPPTGEEAARPPKSGSGRGPASGSDSP